ncbi:autotransporter outer membrane beta-barrel domain-containing protein [Anaerobiospirillum succiniciproducens]|uniref:autotransporter outer membrane beta-barrel domain-containing protein n=1 Tax=Anaerobiospirillum succiniciproducens TaxID=13335 RepID=UPI00040C82E2|nr:autotransporter outer membrane beta-barrel domain-containing protein [Anaerobiospirillum succiniciproducens]
MKQTNNAIKFLMAQYRAIFKNANIAMVAAMAAAALAAGQAQAATPITKWGDLNTTLTQVNAENQLEITAADDPAANNNAFNIEVTAGKHTIVGTKAGGVVNYTAKSGTISLNGQGVTLGIGDPSGTNKGAAVTLKELNVYNGTATIGDAAQRSSLTATKLYIGNKPAAPGIPAPTAAATGKVVVGKSGAITIQGDTSSFEIANGGELNFADSVTADDKVSSKNGIKLNGGTISVTAPTGATVAVIEGGITSTNGTISLAGAKNQNSSLTVSGDVTFDGDSGALSVGQSGSLIVDAGQLKLGNATVTNNGTIEIKNFKDDTKGDTAEKSVLDISKAQYDAIFAGKLELSGSAAGQKFYLNVTDGEVDLNKILTTAGAISGDKLALANSEKFNFSAKAATFNQAAITVAAEKKLTFDKLTAGTAGAFKITGSDITIKKNLTVTKATTADLTIDGNGTLNLDGVGADNVISASKITLGQTGTSSGSLVVKAGDWSIGSVAVTNSGAFQLKGGSVTLNEDASLSIADDSVTIDNAKLDASKAGVIDLGVASAISLSNGAKLILDSADVYEVSKAGDVTLTSGDGTAASKFVKDAVKAADGNTYLQLNSKDKVDAALAKKIRDKISTSFSGFLDFGDKLEALPESQVDYGSKDFTAGVNGLYGNTQIVMKDDNKVKDSLSAANLKLSGSGSDVVADVAADKTLVLTNAGTTHGKNMFIQDASGAVAGVQLAADSALALNGDGAIGSIKAAAPKNGSVTIGGDVNGNGTVTVKGAIGDSTNGIESLTVNKGSHLVVEGIEGATDAEDVKNVYTETLTLNAGSSLKAVGQDVTVTGTGTAKLDGNLTAGKLVFSAANASASIANGALVDVGEFSVSGTGTVSIGTPGVDENNKGTSGTLDADKLTLGGATLFVDPALGDKAAIAAVEKLSDKDANGDAQVLDGKIIVGMNSAVGVGFAGDDKRGQVEQYLIDAELMDPASKSFKKDAGGVKSIKAALILKTPIKVAADKGVLVSSEASSSSTVPNNSFTLGKDGSLIINDSVYGLDGNGAKSGSAVAFDTMGTVTVDSSSKIILTGDFDGADDGIKIFDNVNAIASGTVVTSANGILFGDLDANGTIINLQADDTKLKGAFATISEPVRELLKERIVNSRNTFDKSQLGAQFLGKVANDILDTTGIAADAAAHAATYAGAQQAAVVSVTTMADAMFGRVGAVGVEAASIAATGSQANGGVWLTPMYKSMDSDGFNAQGASYGSDVDAAGVAFGADTVNGNMRFGAVFNIGSGDAEGKGNGNGLKDEFDYYGFGIYSAMGFGNFALVGDASMTVVSHDVEGFGLRGKADTTAVTMGITGQYSIATPVVDVTPHLGARFIRLNTDSYDLISADGLLATTDFDVQNVFSVPLGVTLSKAFVAGGWSLAPSADLTLTFNSGDTEAKSTTTFTGAHAIGLNTEVLDEVQYGLTVGLGAQYGAFGTSFGINYTGSENTDSFGVNAQCRYMF